MSVLAHNNADELKLFRRTNWSHKEMEDLFFTWLYEKQCYVYVNRIRKDGLYENRWEYVKPYHNINSDYGYSKVSERVLNANNIEFTMTVTKISNKNRKVETVKKDVNYIGGQYKAVTVSYLNESTTYTFKADLDIAAKMVEGTLVVVDSSNGLGLGRVVKVYDKDIKDKEAIARYNKATAWIVNIVNTTAQDMRKDSSERKEFILKELAERKEQMEEIAIFEMLAKTDPEAGKLLEELKELTHPTMKELS